MYQVELEPLINSSKSNLSRQQELIEGKVWNLATQRYRKLVPPKDANKFGLLYVSPLNIYLDKDKFPHRCLDIKDDRNSDIVLYANTSQYTYKLDRNIKIA